jgi:hypothetical protein
LFVMHPFLEPFSVSNEKRNPAVGSENHSPHYIRMYDEPLRFTEHREFVKFLAMEKRSKALSSVLLSKIRLSFCPLSTRLINRLAKALWCRPLSSFLTHLPPTLLNCSHF